MSRDFGAFGVVLLVFAGFAFVAPGAYLAQSTLGNPDARQGFEDAFQSWTYYAVPWLLGVAVAAAAVAFRLPVLKAVGLGLMTVPVWETLWGILDSLVELLQGGFVLIAYSRPDLSRIYSIKLLSDLGYLGTGFLLFAGGWRVLSQTPRSLAARLASLGFPMGGRGEGASAFIGLLGFPLLLLGTIGVDFATRGLESLRQSDESSVFANMTVYHAVLISLAAAFGEELVYRGFLQTALARAGARILRGHPATGARSPVGLGVIAGSTLFVLMVLVGTAIVQDASLLGWPLLVVALACAAVGLATWRFGLIVPAIVAQAIFFGFAHGGYATWIHVLLPTLFGVVAGVAAWRFGIWSAIVLHIVVDLYAFFAEVAAREAWMWTALNIAFYANLALSGGWAIAWLVRRHGKTTSLA